MKRIHNVVGARQKCVISGDRFYFPSIRRKTIAKVIHSSGIYFLQLVTHKCPFSSWGATTDAAFLEEIALIIPSRVSRTITVLGRYFCYCTIALSECVVIIIALFISPLNFVLHLLYWLFFVVDTLPFINVGWNEKSMTKWMNFLGQ